MSWLDSIVSNAGTTIQSVNNQIVSAVTGIGSDPVFGPLSSTIPFPVLMPTDPHSALGKLATGLAVSGAPAGAAIVASYFQALEARATDHLKPLPDILRHLLQAHYREIDLGRIYYADSMPDHSFAMDALTVDRHIYMKGNRDFIGSRGDLQLLLHELQHCVQYEIMGGHGEFLLRYMAEGTASAVLVPISWVEGIARTMIDGSWTEHNLHDSMGTEAEATSKAEALIDEIWNALQNPAPYLVGKEVGCAGKPHGIVFDNKLLLFEVGETLRCFTDGGFIGLDERTYGKISVLASIRRGQRAIKKVVNGQDSPGAFATDDNGVRMMFWLDHWLPIANNDSNLVEVPANDFDSYTYRGDLRVHPRHV
jgi:hypothetical protein